ncbi:hypothetical protein TWF696_003136 [Orbilia brochopaga]|uniref:HMG box domain-containing protein n=1 Tax=Orbilia brochopaga TaxID=3140254 RepID=A0AAV9U225_9PEZI
MGRVRSQKKKNVFSSFKLKKNNKRCKTGLTEVSSSAPDGCPNLVLLGFQQGLRFRGIYKIFQRHGIKEHGRITQLMQEQWGSCPKYTNKLNKYWWNLQDEQKAHFKMLKQETRSLRKTREKLESTENKAAGEKSTATVDTRADSEDHSKGNIDKLKSFTFKFKSNNAKLSNMIAQKGGPKESTVPQNARSDKVLGNHEEVGMIWKVDKQSLASKASVTKSKGDAGSACTAMKELEYKLASCDLK